MTGEKNTNRAGARKGARAQSQPKPTAARASRPAARPKACEQRPPGEPAPTPAAEGDAPSPERAGPFSLELPVVIEHVIGLDPARTPAHRLRQVAAVRGLAICESLFWVMQQLGHMVGNDGWLYDSGDLGEALDCLGEVGKAVASGASEQAQHLEHIAERLHRGRD